MASPTSDVSFLLQVNSRKHPSFLFTFKLSQTTNFNCKYFRSKQHSRVLQQIKVALPVSPRHNRSAGFLKAQCELGLQLVLPGRVAEGHVFQGERAATVRDARHAYQERNEMLGLGLRELSACS